MQFLKILFWCLLAFVAALFTYGNWAYVDIQLWSGLIAEVRLPLLLLATFLLGFVPAQIYHGTTRWRLRQRLAATERTLADARALLLPAEPVMPVVPVGTPPALVPGPVPTEPPPDPA